MNTQCFDCKKTFSWKKIVTICPDCSWPLVWNEKFEKYILSLPKKYGIKINDYFWNTSLTKLDTSVYVKQEYENPTWSFKDRGTIHEILFAKDNGYDKIVCASTGNMAVSIWYFCDKFSLSWIVFVPSCTPKYRIDALKKYNIEIRIIDDNYDTCAKLAMIESQKDDTLLVWDYLIRRLGQQSCGIEIAEYKEKFDYIFCPIGNWTFFDGVVKWFLETKKEKNQTIFVWVQWQWCDPLYQARVTWKKWIPIKTPSTLWAYFKVGNPGEWNIAMNYVYSNNYLMWIVDDQEMDNAVWKLKEKFGVKTNYTSASVYACYKKFLKEWKIIKSDKVLLILTGK